MTQITTTRGPADAELTTPGDSRGVRSLLVLGHGAGGGVDAPDLVAIRAAALTRGVAVALVTQPYRVAGRRAPPPAAHLDEAWTAVVAAIRTGPLAEVPLVVGGRSSGARVACRTAKATGATAILALAFPLHPPGRPEKSRADELLTGVPTLVVNGDLDPFGVPEPSDGVEILVRPGRRHDLRGDLKGTSALVMDWMCRLRPAP